MEVVPRARGPLGLRGVSQAGAANTPGPLGFQDYAGRLALSQVGGTTSAEEPELDEEQFRAAVLAEQIATNRRRGSPYFAAVPDSELMTVEGEHRLRTSAATACISLLASARDASSTQREQRDALALLTSSIGITSSYRDYAQDEAAWNRAYRRYYPATASERAAAPGGEHGRAAVGILADYFRSRKAAPGFSTHSDGRAVDFETVHSGRLYTADSTQRAGWRTTWFWRWLTQNAGGFGFVQLDTEEWHWSHT